MKVISSVKEMQIVALQSRCQGQRTGFVPTMGYLHEGHLSLMKAARGISDLLVASIFVNPTQFGPGEDYESYPRDLDRDLDMCAGASVDIVFCPDAGDMYRGGHSTYVDETKLSLGLCGASRPSHFRGVVTVVVKLLNIVQPHVAVFGQKDAQQARVIQKIVHDLNVPVEIIVVPTVREADGLAMSSRNVRLLPSERQEALCIYESLRLAERMYIEGTRDAGAITKAMEGLISGTPSARIDYIEAVDYHTLEPVERIQGATLVAVAVRIGQTRLIDNIIIGSRDA